MTHRKLALVAVFITWLFLSAAASAQCTRCCGVQGFRTTVSVAPTTAEEAQPVSVTIAVSSCYSTAKAFTAKVNITPETSACASDAEAFSVSGMIYPGQHRIFTYTLPAPKCESIYKVIMNGAVRATLTVN